MLDRVDTVLNEKIAPRNFRDEVRKSAGVDEVLAIFKRFGDR
jgi:hypothetical protein